MDESSQGTTAHEGSNIPYTHRPVFPRGNGRRPRGNRSGNDQSHRQGAEGPQRQEQGPRRQRRNTNRSNQEPDEGNQLIAAHSNAAFEHGQNGQTARGRGRSNYRGRQFSRGQGNRRSHINTTGTNSSDAPRVPPVPLMSVHTESAPPSEGSSQRGRGGRGNNRTRNRGPHENEAHNFNVNARPFVPSSAPVADHSRQDANGGPIPTSSQEFGRSAPRRGRNPPRGSRGHSLPQRNRPQRHRNQKDSDLPLRERLKNSLEDNDYECMICCQLITAKQGIWTCKMCYHMFHISGGCIVNWAKKSREEDGQWRCPTCQTKYSAIPYNYYCFCGKHRNPLLQIGETPHSCGNVCGGSRGPGCPHPCSEPCHPGPCVECPVMVTQKCNCGAMEKTTRCGAGTQVSCEKPCDRLLPCGVHRCAQVCHSGTCLPCEEELTQKCFCGKHEKLVPCHVTPGLYTYSCGEPCEGKYDCGIHQCDGRCHSTGATCGPCASSPERITRCPCGRSLLEDLGVSRSSCADPIPTCQSMCNKILRCGSSEKPHRCRSACHTGSCPPCTYNTSVTCRCKQLKKTVPCTEYLQIIDKGEYLCEKRCKKKKSCGLHKCQETCCILEDHYCMQVCNKRLSCGLHNCEALCHGTSDCGRCLNASFEEQFCHCGRTMRPPPIPCGAPLPECDEPCARPHACNHSVNHKCHSDSTCPPCTFLVERECYGGHEIRKNIPCHMQSVSCGRECGKMMACGVHTCPRRCHFGDCLAPGEKCTLPCSTIRVPCEHPCGVPCHEKQSCPETVCQFPVAALCECGRRKEILKCTEVEKAKQRIRALLAENAAENTAVLEEGEPAPGVLKKTRSMENLACLSCTDECKKIARNKKIAEALSIVTNDEGDVEAPTITFTETMKSGLKAWPQLVASLEKIFAGMIDVLNDVTQSSNAASYNFPPMPMEKRRLVHEYANFFHLETMSVDEVPKRSVMVTGRRGVAKPPLILLSDLQNYPKVLRTVGSTTLRSHVNDEIKKAAQAEESGMKSLRAERKVVKRMPPKVAVPAPVKQHNNFAVLCSDDEEEHVRHAVEKAVKTEPVLHERDVDWWSDEEEVVHEQAEEDEPKEEEKVEDLEKKVEDLAVGEEGPKESWSDGEADTA